MNNSGAYIFFVMGVSGCGKSTIGKLLAKTLSIPFYDGDDYHPETNIAKMSAGEPLNDQDRAGWLRTLNRLARENAATGAVIACSALKVSYRDLLKEGMETQTKWVYLEGSFAEILARHRNRKDHFMPTDLLQSQFDILEPPTDAPGISISKSPQEIVSEVLARV
ncbi:gluconokinase [Spongiimicrobium sp. 2-473A-2-J]|uniref:gluconokinase n=1 Tax=Eudoraea algarum TaxID=3417568 RepID=UPI003D36298A